MKNKFHSFSLSKSEDITNLNRYEKKKRKNYQSNFNKVHNKKIGSVLNYQRSFDIPNTDPDLYLENNINSPINFTTNSTEINNTEVVMTSKKLKDNYVDMSSKRKAGKQLRTDFDEFIVKNLNYGGAINHEDLFTNKEILIFNNLLTQILSSSTKFNTSRTKSKKYRLNFVNPSSFDLYDEYLEEYNKNKEKLYLKEAANMLLTKLTRKKKEFPKARLKQVTGNNNLDQIMENIVRKIEIRTNANEIISVENISNMIREELETEEFDSELNSKYSNEKNKKNENTNSGNEYEIFNEYNPDLVNVNVQNNNFFTDEAEKESYLPLIYSGSNKKNYINNLDNNKKNNINNQNTCTTKETSDMETDTKIPFNNYEMIANVRKIKRRRGDVYETIEQDQQKNYRYRKDGNGKYVLVEVKEEDLKSKKNNEILIHENVIPSFMQNERRRRRKKKCSTIEEFGTSINNYKDNGYKNFFGDEVVEKRKSFYLKYLKFQKTHLNFPNKSPKFDSFLITQSSDIYDDFGRSIGNLDKKFQNIKEMKIEKEYSETNEMRNYQDILEDNNILNTLNIHTDFDNTTKNKLLTIRSERSNSNVNMGRINDNLNSDILVSMGTNNGFGGEVSIVSNSKTSMSEKEIEIQRIKEKKAKFAKKFQRRITKIGKINIEEEKEKERKRLNEQKEKDKDNQRASSPRKSPKKEDKDNKLLRKVKRKKTVIKNRINPIPESPELRSGVKYEDDISNDYTENLEYSESKSQDRNRNEKRRTRKNRTLPGIDPNSKVPGQLKIDNEYKFLSGELPIQQGEMRVGKDPRLDNLNVNFLDDLFEEPKKKKKPSMLKEKKKSKIEQLELYEGVADFESDSIESGESYVIEEFDEELQRFTSAKAKKTRKESEYKKNEIKPAYESKRTYAKGLKDELEEKSDKIESILKMILEMEQGKFNNKEEARKYVENIYFPKRQMRRRRTKECPIMINERNDLYIKPNQEDDEETKRRKKVYRESKKPSRLIPQEDEILKFKRRVNNGLLNKLNYTKDYLISICQDKEVSFGYEKLYQDLLDNGDLDPDIFMERIQSAFKLLKSEEEALEEIREHERRLNDFKADMVDEMYRHKLRIEQKCKHMKIADSTPKSKNLIKNSLDMLQDFDDSFHNIPNEEE